MGCPWAGLCSGWPGHAEGLQGPPGLGRVGLQQSPRGWCMPCPGSLGLRLAGKAGRRAQLWGGWAPEEIRGGKGRETAQASSRLNRQWRAVEREAGEPAEGSELPSLGVGQIPAPRGPRRMSEPWGRDESQDSFLRSQSMAHPILHPHFLPYLCSLEGRGKAVPASHPPSEQNTTTRTAQVSASRLPRHPQALPLPGTGKAQRADTSTGLTARGGKTPIRGAFPPGQSL